ncbi:MAG: hypothetical protein HUJ67_01475, partial [Ruminiclostridium sp.]|nr:hypothetical protein [Ruminiclostridium sp.]
MIHLVCNGQQLSIDAEETLVSGTVGRYTFDLETDEAWTGLALKVIFRGSGKTIEVEYAGAALVPWEVLQNSGTLSISVVGHAEGEQYPTMYAPGNSTLFVF